MFVHVCVCVCLCVFVHIYIIYAVESVPFTSCKVPLY